MKKNKTIIYLKNLISRILITLIIFLILAIISKTNSSYKDKIINNIYEKRISFIKIKNIYNKYLGGVVPLDRIIKNEQPVFKEQLEYKNKTIYYEGVKLEVGTNYLVPVIQEGMVVYIGEKENYGNVVIIEGIDGIDIWYGNIQNISVKLYDYIEKNTYLGETKSDSLYLVYTKDGKYQNFEDYLK